MTDMTGRRAGAFIGLAAGDAAGWPSRHHRAGLLPPWTRRLRRELDTFAETEEVTSLPVPFALNQPTEALRLGPSDDAEWVAWTARRLLTDGLPGTAAEVHDRWIEAALSGSVPRGRISVATAVDAMRRGVRPPVTGHDNPHHFDDAAAVRAVAIGALAGDAGVAADVATWDGEVTNGGDGLAAARAVAVAVAGLVAGSGWDVTRSALLGELPADALPGRTVRTALELVVDAPSPAAAVVVLDDVVDRVYSYGTAAAQTLAVAVALTDVSVRTRSAPMDAVVAATVLGSLADSAPALTGALGGALSGLETLPPSWIERSRRLVGCCSADLAGVDLLDLTTAPSLKGRT